MKRCSWAENTASMKEYHDTIWGVPEYDDQRLYRKLMLDINQAGLSWQTILNKTEAFDSAYDHFLQKKWRHMTKIKQNRCFKIKELFVIEEKLKLLFIMLRPFKIQQEFGSFATFLWSFSDGEVVNHMYQTQEEIPTTSELSDKITKELKKQGFKFVGSTTIYAFLEAVGIINDHVIDCFRHSEVKQSTIQEDESID